MKAIEFSAPTRLRRGDAGTLAEGGRKHQPVSPVYTADLTTRSCTPDWPLNHGYART
jgi:hypothetical protein